MLLLLYNHTNIRDAVTICNELPDTPTRCGIKSESLRERERFTQTYAVFLPVYIFGYAIIGIGCSVVVGVAIAMYLEIRYTFTKHEMVVIG